MNGCLVDRPQGEVGSRHPRWGSRGSSRSVSSTPPGRRAQHPRGRRCAATRTPRTPQPRVPRPRPADRTTSSRWSTAGRWRQRDHGSTARRGASRRRGRRAAGHCGPRRRAGAEPRRRHARRQAIGTAPGCGPGTPGAGAIRPTSGVPARIPSNGVWNPASQSSSNSSRTGQRLSSGGSHGLRMYWSRWILLIASIAASVSAYAVSRTARGVGVQCPRPGQQLGSAQRGHALVGHDQRHRILGQGKLLERAQGGQAVRCRQDAESGGIPAAQIADDRGEHRPVVVDRHDRRLGPGGSRGSRRVDRRLPPLWYHGPPALVASRPRAGIAVATEVVWSAADSTDVPIPSGLVRPRSPPPIPQPEWPVGEWAEGWVEGVGLGNQVQSGLFGGQVRITLVGPDEVWIGPRVRALRAG
jgi:hypothetical protein